MLLSIAEEKMEAVAVLTLAGRITLGEGSEQLRQAVGGLVERGEQLIVVDLGEVDLIDSSGVGELVSALARVRAAGGQLEICAANGRIGQLFALLHLDKIFPLHADRAAALASFRPAP